MRNWSAIAALLLALLAHAAEPAHIEGTIFDRTTHQPVPEATVVLRHRTSPARVQTTTSSTNGVYRFDIETAGEYAVEAEAPGYVPADYSLQQPFAKIEEDPTTEDVIPSSHSLDLSLTRAAALIGRVKDGHTQSPIAAMAVRLWEMHWQRGERVFKENHIAFTGDDGSFRFEALASGDYFLEINSRAGFEFLAFPPPEYSAAAPRPVAYPTLFWPSNDPDAGVPFTIRNTGAIELGDLLISRIPLGRIRINFSALGCPEDAAFNLSLDRKLGANTARWNGGDPYSCADSLTAINLSPGEYRIQSIVRPPDPSQNFAWASVHVEEGADIYVDLAGRGDIRISGVVECQCAEGWRDRVAGSEVRLMPLAPGISIGYSQGQVDSKGSFQVGGAFTGLASLAFRPAGFSIAKILYNGSEVGPNFTPDPYAASQSLRIVLSDRPSSVSGTVRRDLSAKPGAHVVLARWPLGDPFSLNATAGTDGQFQIGALGPGTYRAVALDDAMWRDANLPGILAGWLAAGQEFNLGEGETKQITIQLTRP